MSETSLPRIKNILIKCIEDNNINLDGLVVLTEAASGPYLYTPILAAMAGAKKVYAIAGDSSYGKKEDIKEQTLRVADIFGANERLEIIFDRTGPQIQESDIITNSGFVRPIDRRMIDSMKKTAVIPLMWETWEFRESDLDLEACREKGILVLGTDESKKPLDMYPYSGFLAMKLIFQLGLEGYKTNVILLGSGLALAKSIYDHFKQLGMGVAWFSDTEDGGRPYEELKGYWMENGKNVDAIILAELKNDVCLLGDNGIVGYADLVKINPAVGIGVIAGNINATGLKRSGLPYYPEKIKPYGFMSYQAYDLGPRPVLELYAAGLKVGEDMAKARLKGMDIKDAKDYVLKNSNAMDF
jgi:hypothetical protein